MPFFLLRIIKKIIVPSITANTKAIITVERFSMCSLLFIDSLLFALNQELLFLARLRRSCAYHWGKNFLKKIFPPNLLLKNFIGGLRPFFFFSRDPRNFYFCFAACGRNSRNSIAAISRNAAIAPITFPLPLNKQPN